MAMRKADVANVEWDPDWAARAKLYAVIVCASAVLGFVFLVAVLVRPADSASAVLGVAAAMLCGLAFITLMRHGGDIAMLTARRVATAEQLERISEILATHATDPRFAMIRTKLAAIQDVRDLYERDAGALIDSAARVEAADRRDAAAVAIQKHTRGTAHQG